MSRDFKGTLYLDSYESKNFISQLLAPNMENIERRDAFLKKYSGEISDYHEDGSMSFTIPGLDFETLLEDANEIKKYKYTQNAKYETYSEINWVSVNEVNRSKKYNFRPKTNCTERHLAFFNNYDFACA